MLTSERLRRARKAKANHEQRSPTFQLWDDVLERAELEEAAGFEGEPEDFKEYLQELRKLRDDLIADFGAKFKAGFDAMGAALEERAARKL